MISATISAKSYTKLKFGMLKFSIYGTIYLCSLPIVISLICGTI